MKDNLYRIAIFVLTFLSSLTPVEVIKDMGQSRAIARCADDLTLELPVNNGNVFIYNDITTSNTIELLEYGVNTGESVPDNGDEGNYSIATINAVVRANQTGNKTYVYKLAIGGTGLSEGTASVEFWDSNKSGSLWDRHVSNWNDFVEELMVMGEIPNVIYTNWMQGLADASLISTANTYESLLIDFVTDDKALVGEHEYRIQLVDDRFFPGGGAPTSRPFTQNIYEAQIGSLEVLTNVSLYTTSDCDFCDNAHYTAECHLFKGLNFWD